MMTQARYFDGKSSQPFAAEVTLNDKGLTLNLTRGEEQTTHFYPFVDLILISKLKENQAAVFTAKPQKKIRLVIEDKELYENILKVLPTKNKLKSEVSHSWGMLGLIAFACLLAFLVALLAIPVGAPYIAKIIPFGWDNKLGKWALQDVVEDQHECVSEEGLAALNKMVTALIDPMQVEHPFDVRVIKVKGAPPNAFTLPGQHIIIFNSLLNFANNPDEVTGVLAHEMGHALAHHPTAGILRIIGFKAIMIGAFGSSTEIASGFLNIQYTRKNEEEADAIATQLLHQSQISNKGFAQFFKKMKREYAGEEAGWMRYLATHPGLEQRMEYVSKQPNPVETHPSLTREEWQALKNICKKTAPLKLEEE